MTTNTHDVHGGILTELVADEGKLLTNGEVYSNSIYLGTHDSVANWREIDESEIIEQEDMIE